MEVIINGINYIPQPVAHTEQTMIAKVEAQQQPQSSWPIKCCICGNDATVPFEPKLGSNNLKCRDCHQKGVMK